MWLRGAFGVGSSVVLLIACGGDGSTPAPAPTPTSETSPTDPAVGTPPAEEPVQDPPKQEEQGPTQMSVVSASPSCAPIGSRVVLKLGMTFDRRSVDCYDVDAVQVVFAPDKQAKITVMGPMSDGFCAIDVEVPKGAESGKVRVDVGRDVFETDSTFPIPCP